MRLVMPLIGGILISDTVGNTGNQTHLITCVLVPVLALTVFSFIYGDRFPRLYGFFLSLSFLLTGALVYLLQMDRVKVAWPLEKADYQGWLTDWPYERANSFRLDLTLDDSSYRGAKIYLYIPKDSTVNTLTPGDRIKFSGEIKKPQPDAVPGFDYCKYLYQHGVSGTLWVNRQSWQRIYGERKGGLKMMAVRARYAMFDNYKEWGLEGKPLALIAAVSLGNKRELDERTRELYSASGASHLLAVSGLHVGILYSFLYFLLPSFMNRRSLQLIRDFFVICVMWFFAFLTGLPVSIIRSVVMFSVLIFYKAIGREGLSINTLALTALIMLVVNPASLFDIGFRLSFCAVLSILLFGPLISEILKTRSKVGGWVRDLMSVSVAAQIGTTPMVMYSFTGFPTYFILTNLLTIPVMFLIVLFSMGLWTFSWLIPLRNLIVKSLVVLSNMLDSMLSCIVSFPFSRIEVSIESAWKVWALYGMIISVYCWLTEKKTNYFVKALSIVALWSVVGLLSDTV